MSEAPRLTPDEVRKVARLSRLALSDEQVERYRTQLSAVLGYMDRLRQVDLTGVEPMAHAGEAVSRLADDTPGPTLATGAFMSMAPEKWPPFIKVPKVIDEGGGA
jgi:aspartyl-tRNA(Asn)/glutamyl-tRNA(Gln) amidotransferase subunit C